MAYLRALQEYWFYTDGIVSQTDVSEAAYVIDENEVNRFSDNIISGAPLDDG